jgi:hypothetical protein
MQTLVAYAFSAAYITFVGWLASSVFLSNLLLLGSPSSSLDLRVRLHSHNDCGLFDCDLLIVQLTGKR